MFTTDELVGFERLAAVQNWSQIRLMKEVLAANRERALRDFSPLLTIREGSGLQSWYSGEVLAAVATERDELRRRVDDQRFLASEMLLEQLRKREYDKGYSKGLQIGKMSL